MIQPTETVAESEAAEPASDSISAESESDGAQSEAPAEQILIEVWRLQRHQRPANPRPQNRPRGAGRGRDGGQQGQQQGPGRPESGRPDQRRAEGGERPGNEGGPRTGRDRGPRRERFEGVRPERRDEQRNAEQRHAAPRPDQRPPRRERAPDPDSPFAKLAALKAQLEAGDGGKR